ncbi:OSW5 (YMR148W) [Zygosaccharomyces parabailii]|uniref:Outer spore wall protein 5 n=1 Tax=Zygosaccharomyces bailii (strain CLIB 213 / ATCC 58445 / CBS 680 / BCRC 21525 / NBRC 1098 / NCYC 1416 / NRRL Y-2227) TaxID=1333698 RepID=A0A8J2X7A8_ZYGB2|nr:OSW5 (YMR148W) [Zygosaccharomyces parabailii]CDF88481.1 BN860_11254g1_1 [Zygosaccharomyces bailii CLIB 213]CDH14640.1 related to Outer spore wall protein 5 [Zygosaccharomyces bailii ISA1307]SJM82179.1 related to Outer spore wall protein 5 [Zygosaccharomyces bailii]
MATLSSIYFLIYFVSFLAIAAAASFIIIPLLCISFIFASAVVVFGFLSDTTFRFAQSLYIKTDHRLKSTLSKMGTLKKKEKSEKEELAINTEKQHNDLRCRNLVESSGISSTNTNPDAHVFGTDVRVTK